MKDSEKYKDLANKEDNNLKDMGLYIKSNREKRGEDFKEDYLPKLLDKYIVETDPNFTKYTIITDDVYGTVDFFPKSNKLLIRNRNKCLQNGRDWINKNLL